MNLDNFVKDIYKTSKKYDLKLYLLWELIDYQEIKRVFRDKPEDPEYSLSVVQRFLQMKYSK